ncbi:magnesium chelatase subunit D [Methyloversatilis sp. RAC08]|uniref:magnesium chelatase subunit D n=1 Tax=Methyloversatilis sp. RAC08 TaxID=1842540 RepID=UPI000B05D1C2|nr:magnesium chelatase subunit D [Methyloversatilis sp. RAC08]
MENSATPGAEQATVVDDPWLRAALACALCAVDPVGTGGVRLHAQAGPVRDAWLAQLRDMLPPGTPMRRVPFNVTDGRLLGGLDLTATLRAGRPVAERGLLVDAHGGFVLLAMAERLPPGTAARVTAVMDAGEVALARDGIALTSAAAFAVIALDEGLEDEPLSTALCDRLAFHLDLDGLRAQTCTLLPVSAADIEQARARLPVVIVPPGATEALAATALALGVTSMRALLQSVRVARAAAALDGRDAVAADDVTLAAQLVLAPRATQFPTSETAPEQADASPPEPDDTPPEDTPPPEPEAEQDASDSDAQPPADRPLDDVVLEAAQAAIPPGLLARLQAAAGRLPRARSAGRAGALRAGGLRGRPAGIRRGTPGNGARLNLIETLRAAAPWQPLRRAARASAPSNCLIDVRPDDFRITRFAQRSETTTIFLVDASGSSALNRLAEAKGAVELLLADCYVRRDRVALIAFRGTGAEVLLPPTRSLVRAKRSLAGLPGGGGTPLAAGIDAGWLLADAVQRRGDTPTLVLLTDGRANVARDGAGGRARAEEDARSAARRVRASAFRALFIDTSPRPQPAARELALDMAAMYMPLSAADAVSISKIVRAIG